MKYKYNKIYKAGWKHSYSLGIALRYLDNVIYSIKHAGSKMERNYLIDKARNITQTMLFVEAYGKVSGENLNSLRNPVFGRRSKHFEFTKLLDVREEVGEYDE